MTLKDSKLIKVAPVLAGVLIVSNITFAQKVAYPPEVALALDSAKANRGQLEHVLMHYSAAEDSLKFQAACFLIGNMQDHCYATYCLKDTLKNEIAWSIFDYGGYDSLIAAWDRLDSIYGPLDFSKKDLINDLETISDTLLIENIDYAFKSWQEKPWAKKLSFADFCEYVLPYRGSNEPLEQWRKTLWEKYQSLADSMVNPADPIEAARLINNDIKTWFGFDSVYYFHPTDQGLSEMLRNRKGRCEDMTNLAIYAMRANGLAVTSDYTPHWADAGNNHAWNAIVTGDGRVVPFMGAEANPGEYSLFHKWAKAYRKTYSVQSDNLAFQKKKQAKVPGWLGGKCYTDVTSAYAEIADATAKLNRPIPDSVDIAYLCVFNSGEWEAVHWGQINGDSVTFTAMATEVVYLPALYLNEKIVPYEIPFVLHKGDVKTELCSDTLNRINVTLTAATPPQTAPTSQDSAESFLIAGQSYELFYWLEGWKSAGKILADDKPLLFSNIPSGGLYRLVADNSDKEERIFTIKDGKQVWW